MRILELAVQAGSLLAGTMKEGGKKRPSAFTGLNRQGGIFVLTILFVIQSGSGPFYWLHGYGTAELLCRLIERHSNGADSCGRVASSRRIGAGAKRPPPAEGSALAVVVFALGSVTHKRYLTQYFVSFSSPVARIEPILHDL